MFDSFLRPLVRCVQDDRDGRPCRGTLFPVADALECESCEYRYPIAHGVPVLRSGSDATADAGFELVYTGRSPNDDLASDYLRSEREFMTEFSRHRHLRGPCLEIGCGTGLFADAVPQYVGLEYSLESLFATGFESAGRICGDARRLPLADSSMECIFSFCTLEHVPELDLAFEEIDRVLQPGGMLVLKPAWHCTRYTTELIPMRPYRELNLGRKLTKALLPLIQSKPYKLLTWTLWRLARRLTRRPNNPLQWTPLTPYYGVDWISDADATSGIDCHKGILYFTSRDYLCHSHRSELRQLLAGHDIVVLEKAGRPIPSTATGVGRHVANEAIHHVGSH